MYLIGMLALGLVIIMQLILIAGVLFLLYILVKPNTRNDRDVSVNMRF